MERYVSGEENVQFITKTINEIINYNFKRIISVSVLRARFTNVVKLQHGL